ncbi:hypothetical protein DBADOPDK_04029 [Pseudomonas sp. MM223]|nr:hypothetical protein DBADOPDK_04029 [Pseudomonas sp. MM223]
MHSLGISFVISQVSFLSGMSFNVLKFVGSKMLLGRTDVVSLR